MEPKIPTPVADYEDYDITQDLAAETGHGHGVRGHAAGHPPAGHAAAPHGHGDDEIDLDIAKPRPVWVVVAAVIGIAALGALLFTGLLPRKRDAKELDADAAEAAIAPVTVNVVAPHRGPTTVPVELPGTLRPWQEVSIFARATGYLKKYNYDISEEVEAGKVLAEVDSPELNQELNQSQAALNQAHANKKQAQAMVVKSTADRNLAKVTFDRYKALIDTHSVTQQDLDEKQSALNVAESALESSNANVTAAEASVAAAEANVHRLTELQSFEKVVAPFSGVVTGRAYDVGSLIIANPTATDAKPMFKLAENDVLRAFIYVPQSSALDIKKGMEVRVTVRERPGSSYKGIVLGTTNYLDPATRSLMTEVKLNNPKEPDGTFALLPGMYIQASFEVKRDIAPLVVPGPALITNADGTQVAVVEKGVVHFKKVKVGQDFGAEVEVVEGLTGDEQVVANPGERIVEGVRVSTGNAQAAAPVDPAPSAAPAQVTPRATGEGIRGPQPVESTPATRPSRAN